MNMEKPPNDKEANVELSATQPKESEKWKNL
jgi:hypothetical protein